MSSIWVYDNSNKKDLVDDKYYKGLWEKWVRISIYKLIILNGGKYAPWIYNFLRFLIHVFRL